MQSTSVCIKPRKIQEDRKIFCVQTRARVPTCAACESHYPPYPYRERSPSFVRSRAWISLHDCKSYNIYCVGAAKLGIMQKIVASLLMLLFCSAGLVKLTPKINSQAHDEQVSRTLLPGALSLATEWASVFFFISLRQFSSFAALSVFETLFASTVYKTLRTPHAPRKNTRAHFMFRKGISFFILQKLFSWSNRHVIVHVACAFSS